MFEVKYFCIIDKKKKNFIYIYIYIFYDSWTKSLKR